MLREIRLRALRLHVEEHNLRARRSYERLGFQLTGRRLFRDRDGRWELEMEAALEPGSGTGSVLPEPP